MTRRQYFEAKSHSEAVWLAFALLSVTYTTYIVGYDDNCACQTDVVEQQRSYKAYTVC